MEKQVFIIGHRNPDTDSVVSAAAYARLKQAAGFTNYFAARAGKISPQTEYIFDRFKMPVPEFIPDLVPKVAYYFNESASTVSEGLSLWEAMDRMGQDSVKVLPIVNESGSYKGMLHYNAFAKYILTKINPHKKSAFPTSIDLLLKTLRAQPLTAFNTEEIKKSHIVVAASADDTFKKHLDAVVPENALVLTGDRTDIQRYCLERKVRAMIITNGNTLDKELVDLAEKNRVSVMISPFDTASTSLLIIYSTPVGAMGDESVTPVRLTDTVKKIQEPLSRAPSRSLPVLDDDGLVAGVISEGDIIKEPKIEVIMVDHNELTQAVEGIDNYKILEVIDHHRLGGFSTRYPITFINRAVGATCTIVANLYREQRFPLERETASILLCGILADTLVLQSATTTDADHEAAEFLSSITGLDIDSIGAELLTVAGRVNALPADDLVSMDMKEYNEMGAAFTVSQIETDSTDSFIKRKDEVLSVLEQLCASKKLLFASLMVTNLTTLNSLLLIKGSKSLISRIHFPIQDEGIYILNDIVSRKKQLMPLLSELIEQELKK